MDGDTLAGAPGQIAQGACKPAALRRADSGLDVFSENDAPTSPSKRSAPGKGTAGWPSELGRSVTVKLYGNVQTRMVETHKAEFDGQARLI
ncbi:hypothetical protein L1887_59452 [Cichorium endivia]|nr:hypothetical protein L1887_59452 [Cichorium endivia]